jgi:adenine-specific DNA-methyltransferase
LKFAGGGRFERDENGLIKDNLIINGNNLLALHTLKSNFAGKVKLIYIDPPYNTGNDSFNYNDNFNHSTWLTFMKNRLEVARDLLSDDGVIFVSCDDNEQAYLKVLMDEIFGINNFVGNLVIVSAPAGTQSSVNIAQKHSYCLCFSKSKNFSSYKLKLSEKQLNRKYKEKNEKFKYYIERLWKRGVGGRKEDVPSLHFPVFYDKVRDFIYIDDEAKDTNGLIKILPYQTVGILGRWTWSKNKMKKEKQKLIVRIVNGEYKLHKKMYIYDEKGKLPGSIIESEIGRTEMGSLEIKNLFNEKKFAYPKPEKLLERIIEIATKKGDIVLDYHLGSGTTCAVAHKMGRQYIGIEQMDYIEDIAVKRMQKVIEGEQGGISKSVQWQGGGEFIYFELDKYNQVFIDKITKATDKTILKLYDEIIDKAFLNYDVESEKLAQEKNEFKGLNFSEKQEFLISILNKNQLYKNLSEINDKNLGVDDKTKTLNKDFYNE